MELYDDHNQKTIMKMLRMTATETIRMFPEVEAVVQAKVVAS